MSVIVERNGPVTTLVIARPERRNAVDRPTAQALADALREFEADDTARVAVLTGSGGNFCAGATWRRWPRMASGAIAWRRRATDRWGRAACSSASR